MEPKDQHDPPVTAALPVTDVWGLPIPALPSWITPADPADEMGYCTGQDPHDRWD